MKSFYAIYRKELGHYFVSPIAYVIVGVFLIVAGYFFVNILRFFIERATELQFQSMQFGMPPDIDVPTQTLRSFFGVISTLILFITPILTMGVYAEEQRRGTIELLMTSPLTEVEIVLGKFLASLTLFAIMLFPTVLYVVFMYFRSQPTPPWSLLVAGYAGVLLLGGGLLALGLFISSLTESQIIAAVVTFGAFLMLWVLDFGVRGGTSTAGQILQYLSVIHHYDDFTRGVVDTTSLIYYFSLMFFFLFLTVRSVDSMRWRRA
jgi:ABC-2 type transport system permease protein